MLQIIISEIKHDRFVVRIELYTAAKVHLPVVSCWSENAILSKRRIKSQFVTSGLVFSEFVHRKILCYKLTFYYAFI